MRRRKRLFLIAAAVCVGALYLGNASWPARPERAVTRLLAHRGVHQTFACARLENDTCTAACIGPPTHDLLENTIPSMRAAFEAGADIVELDVHPTTDGQIAVFHDWRLECRTDGTGVTRERSMAYLKSLDIGHGYTADGGRTFPLRGRGRGLLPTLAEVLDAFPDRRFLLHIKSDDPADADKLAALLRTRPAAQRANLMVYGGARPTTRLGSLLPGLRGMTKPGLKSCLLRYALLGWTGFVPAACRHSLILLPRNYAPYLWGWPYRFQSRMTRVGTEVFVVGPNAGGEWLSGIDSPEAIESLGPDLPGGIWTDRIEVIGPLLRARQGPGSSP